MPTLADMGLDESGNILGKSFNTLGNIGKPFQSRVTYYAPGPGDRMEGPWATSRPNPATGQRIPSTLDDVRLRGAPYVTVASDPSRYGQKVQLGDLTYRSPIDGKTYTLPQVQGLVHDTGSAFKGRPDKLDVAAGDFRGWNPAAASAYVQADGGNRMVTAGGGSPTGGWETNVSADPSGVGYAPAARVAQGAATNPADLTRQDNKSLASTLGDFFSELQLKAAKPTAPAPTGFAAGQPYRFTPVGQRRA
jgi:hypothetical protein